MNRITPDEVTLIGTIRTLDEGAAHELDRRELSPFGIREFVNVKTVWVE